MRHETDLIFAWTINDGRSPRWCVQSIHGNGRRSYISGAMNRFTTSCAQDFRWRRHVDFACFGASVDAHARAHAWSWDVINRGGRRRDVTRECQKNTWCILLCPPGIDEVPYITSKYEAQATTEISVYSSRFPRYSSAVNNPKARSHCLPGEGYLYCSKAALLK